MAQTTKTPPKKTYNNFNDIHGNVWNFPDYISFANWFFGISRRVLVASIPEETFRKLEREATQSAEARCSMS